MKIAIPQLELATIVSAPFDENTHILRRTGRDDCLVVDPGLEPDRILECLHERRLTPAAILNTHGHSDHIAGNGALKHEWPDCPIIIGALDAPKLSDAWQNLSAMFGGNVTSPPADRLVNEGDAISAAGFDLVVREIPGHSIGHVVFIWRTSKPMLVLGGDVLFAGSVRRADFPDGDFATLRDGIHHKLFTLPDETIVLSGHGPPTTIGRERSTNPYVGAPAGYRPQ